MIRTKGGLPQVIQTSVGEDVIPFLRYKSVAGRLGATLLTDLTGGPWRLPRATGTGGASWQNETAAVANNEVTFDAVTLNLFVAVAFRYSSAFVSSSDSASQ